MYFLMKVIVSALIIAAVSEIAKRNPGFAALVASLPLVSVLAMIWLWRDTQDTNLIAAHAEATFWYVAPSLPMFLVLPALLRSGWPFPVALIAVLVMTAALYAVMTLILARFGVRL